MGEIYELFVLALSLVWFAGATPDCMVHSAQQMKHAVIWGGAKRVGGGGNVPENALSQKFLDPLKGASGLLCRGFLYRKNRALTLEGLRGWKTFRTRGWGPKPLFGRGVIREVFHPPPFSTPPPMASSEMKHENVQKFRPILRPILRPDLRASHIN